MVEQQQDLREHKDYQLDVFRFYKEVYPKIGDYVVGQVIKVEDNVPTLKLLEYANKEAIIAPNELTKTMKQNPQKATRIGSEEVVKIIRVDEERGFIDASKKQVDPETALQCKDKFSKSKQIHSIINALKKKWNEVEEQQLEVNQLYEQLVWPIYEEKHPLDFFKKAIEDNSILNKYSISFAKDSEANNEKLRSFFVSELSKRLHQTQKNIKAEFELKSYQPNGIEIIKAAMIAGEKYNDKNTEVKFHIIGSPIYSASLTTVDKEKGLQIIKLALEEVEKYMVANQCQYALKKEPHVYGDNDDDQFFNQFKKQEDEEEEDDGEDSDIEGLEVDEGEDDDNNNQ